MSNKLLKSFMKEFFPYAEFKKAGIFTKEMRGNYEAQAEKICKILGYKSIYEYRSKSIQCHISFGCNERPLFVNEKGKLETEPFVTVIEDIYT